jgi:hypothetical protein
LGASHPGFVSSIIRRAATRAFHGAQAV